MERQVYSWFIQYVASSTNVDQREATRLADQIFSWRDSYGSSYKDVLCSHTPRILLPVAHALVDDWKGDDCLIGFVDIAHNYGASSLDPLSMLLKYGLAEQYKSLLAKTYLTKIGFFDKLTSDIDFNKSARARVVEQEYDARWLAVQTIAVLLERIKKGTIHDQGHCRWNAKSAAEEILRRSLDAWKDEANRYYGNGCAANRLRTIESTLREIVQYL